MSFSFNSDGSLAVKAKTKRDHLPLLRAIDELPFGMGHKLLTDHLRGRTNAKTMRLKLDKYTSFGQLGGFQDEEVTKLINHVKKLDLITTKKEKGFYQVYIITDPGKQELLNPQHLVDINKLSQHPETHIENPFTEKTRITDDERKLFTALHDFFPHFNDEQKKAVISQAQHILCVAGAGSGKTSVLTKRVEFLNKYKSVSANKILAITFTRKARKEMRMRLQKLGVNCHVETFNSFCEKILLRYGNQSEQMLSMREQIQYLIESLKEHGQDPQSIVKQYFTSRQRAGKDDKSLFFSFSYDFQSLIERIKIMQTSVDDLRSKILPHQEHAKLAHLMLDLAESYLEKTSNNRDFADQLIKTLALFEKRPEIIPEYQHVLVDEYQDVNDQQIKLLKLLKPHYLFVVGDPRQSIYGWRGSRIQHIIGFTEEYQDAEIIQLTKNYRSDQSIVDICNRVAKRTGYHSLESSTQNKGLVTQQSFSSEEEQASYVARKIASYPGDKKDIFVLSRTNKGLKAIQNQLQSLDITFLIRTEELKRPSVEAQANQVTLATVHGIKGLEAKIVYIINANTQNFPCKAQDHPVMDLFHLNEDYDSFAEELRVFYVALSRAEKELHICWTGALTHFLPNRSEAKTKKLSTSTDSLAAMMKLRSWRYQQAKEKGCPAYVICPDKTLQALVDQQPRSVDDLHGIPGLGKQRIIEFGEDLILELQKL